MDLSGKVALITGADSGIGQATAAAFAKAGADVCITFHTDEDGAKETKRQVETAGRRALVMQCDVTDAGSVQAVFDRTAVDLGIPDLLVANAGTGMGGMPVAEMDDAKMMEVLQTDLVGPLFCARAFVRQRKAAGGAGRPDAGSQAACACFGLASETTWKRPLSSSPCRQLAGVYA